MTEPENNKKIPECIHSTIYFLWFIVALIYLPWRIFEIQSFDKYFRRLLPFEELAGFEAAIFLCASNLVLALTMLVVFRDGDALKFFALAIGGVAILVVIGAVL